MDQHLLVVDWDSFFPNPLDGGEYVGRKDNLLYDWTKAEAPIYIDMLWTTRASGFIREGLELPRASGYHGFWDRFDYADQENTTLWVADSNRHAGHMTPDTDFPFYDSVWLFDAHHDCGYKVRSMKEFEESPTFDCEDWMLCHARNGAELHVRYPQWKKYAFDGETEPAVEVDRQFDNGEKPPVAFTDVYLCRSGAWVPSWCDDQFKEFIESWPYDWDEYPNTDPTELFRNFNRAEVETIVAAENELRKRVAQS